MPVNDPLYEAMRQMRPDATPTPRATERVPDPFEQAAEQVRKQDREQKRQQLIDAPPAAQAAEAKRLSQETGLPPSEIISDVDAARKTVRARKLLEMSDNNPAVAKALREGDLTTAAQLVEDMDNVGLVDQTMELFSKLPERMGVAGGVDAFAAASAAIPDRILDLGDYIQYGVSVPLQVLAEQHGYEGDLTQGALDRIEGRAQVRRDQRAYASEVREANRSDNFVVESLLAGSEFVPLSLAAALTRNPRLATGIPAVTVGQMGYTEAREQGLNFNQAIPYAVSQGVTEYLTERIPAGRLVDALTGATPFGKSLFRSLAAEIPGEQVATAIQDLSDFAYLPENVGKTFGDYVRERPEAAAATLLGTLSGTGIQVGAASAFSKAADVGFQMNQRFSMARTAKAEGKLFSDLADALQKSTMRQSDPEGFAKLLRDMGEARGLSTVLLDGIKAREYLQSDAYDPASDPLAPFAEDILDAAAAGNDVALPFEVALGQLAGTAAFETLREDMRLSPGGMTPREATALEEGAEDIASQLDQIVGERQSAQGDQQGQREKRVAALAEKIEEAGHTPYQAKQLAELVASRIENRQARSASPDVDRAVEDFNVRRVLPPELQRSMAANERDMVMGVLRGNTDGSTSRARAAAEELSVLLERRGFAPEDLSDEQLGQVIDRLTQQGEAGGREYRSRGRDEHWDGEALADAPKVQGEQFGPVQAIVDAARAYAEAQGIDHVRQGEYVDVDPEFAARVADAYAEMEHNPSDPAVAEAYADMIRQTRAQYDALVEAGFTFSFGDPDGDYFKSGYNALRDMRDNQHMQVFPTEAGFGSDATFDPSENPLFEDTGLKWVDHEGNEQTVYANDLFRAVHDAFGHGIEGAGFRARGEENAWQAHSRLFTGPGLAAMTSETRGQNSWVNYGPYGEQNRTASAEDTVYADQKTGLLPQWAWTERRAPDMGALYEQDLQAGETFIPSPEGGEIGWTQHRIDDLVRSFGYASEPERTKAYAVRMSPDQFLGLTASEEGRRLISERVEGMEDYGGGEIDFDQMRANGQPIMLSVNVEPERQVVDMDSDDIMAKITLPEEMRVMGHEGRHRMTMLKRAGVTSVPVVILLENRTQPEGDSLNAQPQRSSMERVSTGDTPTQAEGLVPISYANREQLAEMFGGGRELFQRGPTIREVATSWTVEHHAQHGGPLSPIESAEHYQIVLDGFLADYREQVGEADDGSNWYSGDIMDALEITQQIIPELADPTNREVFLAFAAVLSPQRTPVANWELAIQAMQSYVRTGRVPTTKDNGKGFGLPSTTSALQLLDHLIQTKGAQEAMAWLAEPHNGREVAELRRDSGAFGQKDKLIDYKAREFNYNEEKPGVYIFGGKVGAFMSNVMGLDHNAVTVDLWAYRAYARHSGRLLEDATESTKSGIAEQPTSARGREVVQRLMTDAAAQSNTTPSAMQAALWYSEQRRYRDEGIRAESASFSEGARRAAEARGIRPVGIVERSDAGGVAPEGRSNPRILNQSFDPWVNYENGEWQREAFPFTELGDDPNMAVSEDEETILVDGEERPTRNSHGDLISDYRPSLINFWRWFGDSQMVDENGQPVPYYHGSRAKLASYGYEFSFDPDRGNNTFFFSVDRATARGFANNGDDVMQVYLKSDKVDEHDADYRMWDKVIEPDLYDIQQAEDAWVADQLETFESELEIEEESADENGDPLDEPVWRLRVDGEVLTFDTEEAAQEALEEYQETEREAEEERLRDNIPYIEELAEDGYLEADAWSSTDSLAAAAMGEYDTVRITDVDEGSGPTEIAIILGDPKRIKSTENLGSWNPEDPRIYYQATAFYSALERAAEAVQTQRASAQQWAATLKKTPGVKQEELEWTGILDWLDVQTGPVEKDQLLEVIRRGGIVVREVVLGNPPSDEEIAAYEARVEARADELRIEAEDEWLESYFENGGSYYYEEVTEDDDGEPLDEPKWRLTYAYGDADDTLYDDEDSAIEAADEANASEEEYAFDDWKRRNNEDYYQQAVTELEEDDPREQADRTQFSSWTTDQSNDTYHELLITLPRGEQSNPERAPSTHWDEDAVVAHARFMDKEGPNGERILFVEEVQSDWHQKGRDQGYAVAASQEVIRAAETRATAAAKAVQRAEEALYNKAARLVSAARRDGAEDRWLLEQEEGLQSPNDGVRRNAARSATTTLGGKQAFADYESARLEYVEANQAFARAQQPSGIPNAPFKKSWPELVMKRMIAWASTNGYDQIAWTWGQQQAERYNLSQAVGGINVFGRVGDDYVIRLENTRASDMLASNGLGARTPEAMTMTGEGLQMTPAQVKEAFGAEVFKKIEEGAVRVAGRDLNVGGEGMKQFYDKNLVNITNKLVKKYGAKVEMLEVDRRVGDSTVLREVGFTEKDVREMRANADSLARVDGAEAERLYAAANDLEEQAKRERASARQPGLSITPELREAAASGFPLFQPDHRTNGPRGRILFPGETDEGAIIEMFQGANLSTLIHEISHLWLEELKADAADPNASQQIKDDYATTLKWFKDNGYEVRDGVIPVGAHEMWARTGERYMREGKAPSISLQRAFEAFKNWLTDIYKTVAGLRAPITPEIRDVFDRLIASDEEIAIARETQALNALFDSAAAAGMSKGEFDSYQEQVANARAEASGKVLEKSMKAVRDRETVLWKQREREVRERITNEVEEDPLFRSLSIMRTNRLDREWLLDTFGDDVLDRLPTRVPPLYKAEGMDPEIVAEMAGFRSASEMVDALVSAQASQTAAEESGDDRNLKQRTIGNRVDRAMRAEFGDPLSEGQIEQEAIAAVNGERQGEVLASEIRVLSRSVGKRPAAYQVARQWARNRVRSGNYATEASPAALQRHRRAVSRAGKEAELALANGDREMALQFKQQQMLSSALLAEAKLANEEIEAARRRMAKIAKARTMRSVDQDYLEQAHALLEEVDLKERSQRGIDRFEKWEAWVAQQQEEAKDVVVPASFMAQIGGTNWSRLPIDQLLGLDEAVKQVIHFGRMKQRLLDNKDARDFAAVKAEVRAQAEKAGKKDPISDFEVESFWQRVKARVASADAALLKMETIFDWLDNGDPNGVFNRYVFRPLSNAAARERDMIRDFYEEQKANFEMIDSKTLASWRDKIDTGMIEPKTGLPWTPTREQVVAMALNWGNAGNRQRLADGYGFREPQIERLLMDTLTEQEWQFVQATWDTINKLWPEIAALERRVNGIEPEKIEATEVVTPFGTLKGGYYPAIYNTKIDRKARQYSEEGEDLMNAMTTRATTRASSTKERADTVKRPILLDLGVINRHMAEVIHDVTHREAIIQANRLLSDPEVLDEVDAVLGREYSDGFRPWLKYVANQWSSERAANEGAGWFFRKLRANATVVGMGFRFTTIMTQFAGYSNSIEILGAARMTAEIAKASASPVDTFNFVMERSGMMRSRTDTIDRDINQAMRDMIQPKAQRKAKQALTSAKVFAFHGIGYADRIVSIPTWMGGYNRALENGATEEQAIYEGDKAVRMSQGSADALDLAAVQRGTGKWGELLKLATMFYSYMSAFYQRQRHFGRDVTKAGVKELPGLIARAWWLFIIPPMLAEFLAGRGPDEDEDEAWWAFKKMVSQSLGPIPIVRDVWEPAWDRAVKNPSFGYRFTPAQGAMESGINLAGDIGRISRGEDTKRMTRNTMEFIGYTTGLIPGQFASAAQFWVDVSEGEQDPDGAWEMIEGTVKGKVSEE